MEPDDLVGTNRNTPKAASDGGLLFCLDERRQLASPSIAAHRTASTTRRRGGDAMNRTDTPNHVLDRCGCGAALPRRSLRNADAAGHAAAPLAGKQAPGWYRIKVGTTEVTVDRRGRPHQPAARQFRPQQEQGRGRCRAAGGVPVGRALHAAVQFGGGEHRHRSSLRSTPASARRARDQQRLDGAGPDQPRRRRHRHQRDRHGGDLAFPRRPHQRPRHRRQAGLSERRGHGAGAGMELLDGRRQHEPRAGGA